MRTTRREFLATTGATALVGGMGRISAQSSEPAIPDIRLALEAAGFDPDLPDSALVAVISDLHIGLNPNARWTERLDDAVVAELNGLQPQLTQLAVAGDIISSHSLAAGTARYPGDYLISREEMRTFKSELDRFRPDLEVIMVPGNHDSDNVENHAGGVPQLWLEEIGTPPYQKKILGGVPVFFLNTGHGGNLGPVQAEWFANEAAAVPSEQEVLIVAHHPSFFYIAGEAGMKRKVAAAFAGHRAPVWIIGGHGHGFFEEFYTERDTRFIQMQVTSGNPIQWGDGNQPGYAVLGLQGGRVVSRMFRSLKKQDFFPPRKPLEQLTPKELRWPFDRIEYPAELFEEGEYDRTGRVVSFLGNDLITHIGYIENITCEVDLSRFGGRVSEFLVCAGISNSVIPTMTCAFSENGAEGPWVEESFPPNDGSAVYRLPIPPQFRSCVSLHVKVSTSMLRYGAGITLGGWGLAAARDALSGYEKWISRKYRTLSETSRTAPDAITPGSTLSNIINFAFNLPAARIFPDGGFSDISGLPQYSEKFRNVEGSTQRVSRIVHPRFREETNPGIRYLLEESFDLIGWKPVPDGEFSYEVLRSDGDLDEIEIIVPDMDRVRHFFRVSLELSMPLPAAPA